ncbi:MAG: hypothetical protein PHH85_02285 [Candidatus Methanoperedens sp.]|nr:hypothetical protein [Candidatus Methanoperedens sp.]
MVSVRNTNAKCRKCGRKLRTAQSQKAGLCIVCQPVIPLGVPQSRSQFER